MKDIKTYDNKGQLNGYQQWCYYNTNTCYFMGIIKNGNPINYVMYNSQLIKETIFYIK